MKRCSMRCASTSTHSRRLHSLNSIMVVYNRKGIAGWQEAETLLRELATVIVPVTEDIARCAIEGFARDECRQARTHALRRTLTGSLIFSIACEVSTGIGTPSSWSNSR